MKEEMEEIFKSLDETNKDIINLVAKGMLVSQKTKEEKNE